MLVFRCECDEVLSAELAKASKLGECPGCGKILRIPEKVFEFAKLTLKRSDGTMKVPKPPTTSVKLGDPKKLESKPAAPASVPPPPPPPAAPKEAAKAPAKDSAKAEPKAPPTPPPAKETAKAEIKPSAPPKEPAKTEAKPPAAEKPGKKSGEFTLPPVPPPPPTQMPRPTSAAEEAAEEDEELKRVVQRTAPRERRLDGKPFTNVKGSSGLPMKILLALGGIGVLAGVAYFAGLFGGKAAPEIPNKPPTAPVENKASTPQQTPAPADKPDEKKADTPKTDAQ